METNKFNSRTYSFFFKFKNIKSIDLHTRQNQNIKRRKNLLIFLRENFSTDSAPNGLKFEKEKIYFDSKFSNPFVNYFSNFSISDFEIEIKI